MNRRIIKRILGELPFTVELYWQLVQRNEPWKAHFDLGNLDEILPEAARQTESFAASAPPGKRIFLFTSLHYWIEFSALMGLALAGKGHEVTLSFLPYASWDKPIEKFDLRRQNLYARQVLGKAGSLMRVQSLLDVHPLSQTLPEELEDAVVEVSTFDTQYTLQVEDITREETVYKLRYVRNREAALNARAWLMAHKPDVVLVPNGTIQEMGIVYRVARYLEIPTVTFEFGDKREHIWVAQNSEIMQQETDDLWKVLGDRPLRDDQLQRLKEMYAARINAKTWQNFTRRWQTAPSGGGEATRQKLDLDDRPVILLATNVLGDSLTLNRQVFSQSMAEWIERAVAAFAARQDVQLVIRVHPGEVLKQDASMVDVINTALGEIPAHIHLIKPDEKINTYDIMDITDLGLVYTTTVGLEMAMRGIPVVLAGQTHYRGRGFTHDPDTWDAYFAILDRLLGDLNSAQLSDKAVELAWRYAYLFFFEFPQPFPWHLLDLQNDIKERPLALVLGEEGKNRYDKTFAYLSGEPLTW